VRYTDTITPLETVLQMQENQNWIAMFRRIPGTMQDAIALGLTTGAEIVVQKIVKLEPDFMIVRGRVAGTQDSGRVVLIPYDKLAFVSLTKPLKDPELNGLFGKGAPPAVADLPVESPDSPSPEPAEDMAEDPPMEATAISPPPKKPEAVSKTALLAKLRERLKEGGK